MIDDIRRTKEMQVLQNKPLSELRSINPEEPILEEPDQVMLPGQVAPEAGGGMGGLGDMGGLGGGMGGLGGLSGGGGMGGLGDIGGLGGGGEVGGLGGGGEAGGGGQAPPA